MLYGHRRNIDGYARAASAFDQTLGQLLPLLRADDLLMITADHGCDPGFLRSTDHTREYVPLLMCGESVRAGAEPGHDKRIRRSGCHRVRLAWRICRTARGKPFATHSPINANKKTGKNCPSFYFTVLLLPGNLFSGKASALHFGDPADHQKTLRVDGPDELFHPGSSRLETMLRTICVFWRR